MRCPVQGEEIKSVAAQAGEQGGKRGGDGSGRAETEGGINIAHNIEFETADRRRLTQGGEDETQVGVIGEGVEIGNVVRTSAVNKDAAVSAGAQMNADACGDGTDNSGRAIHHGMLAADHEGAGGRGGELHFKHHRFFAGRQPRCARSRFRAPAGR